MSVATRAITATTIAEAFRLTAEDFGDRVAVRTKDDEVSLTWGQLREWVDALAGGLAELGVRRGDTVALMLSNRPEFHVADLAVMTLGATPFSIYGTFSPEQIAFVGATRARAWRSSRPRSPTRSARLTPTSSTSSCSRTAGRRTRTSTPSRTGARSSPRTS